jgi:hypothetical protein
MKKPDKGFIPKVGGGILSELGKQSQEAFRGLGSKLHASRLKGGSRLASSLFDFEAGSSGRARVVEGLTSIFGHNGKTANFRSALKMEQLMKQNPQQMGRIKRLQSLAKKIGAGGVDSARGRKYLKKAQGIAASLGKVGDATKIRQSINPFSAAKVASAGWAEKGIFKAYQSAIFNPKSIVPYAAAAAIATPHAVARLNRWAEAKYRTQNVGSGSYGTDTRGVLGPASLEGMRFQVMRRKRAG